MLSAETYLPALEPVAPIPRSEVLEARADDFRSDIFPDTYPEANDGPLGNYVSFQVDRDGPLWPVAATLLRRRTQLTQQEKQNRWVRTEESKSGLLNAGLQIYLIGCINKAYGNLLADGHTPARAVTEINHHVEARDDLSWARYKWEIDELVSQQALVECDRAKPMLSSSAIYSQQMVQEQVKQARLRLERLKFEWISARAIGQLLKQRVVVVVGG
jgi:hypothetical protein